MLKDNIAIVTGSAQGIGKEIAKTFLESGAKVVIVDLQSDKLIELEKQFKAMKNVEENNVLAVQCDVSSEVDTLKVITKTLETYGKLDILVNNAGIYPQISFEEMTNKEWLKVININLNGTFNMTKASIIQMIKQKHGKIINIASIAGAVVGYENLVHYAASKGGMLGFTRALATEMAKYHINVNSISPGAIETEGTSDMSEEQHEQTKQLIPIGRWGIPKDIAQMTTFLASEKSNFITGQNIVVDGGQTNRP